MREFQFPFFKIMISVAKISENLCRAVHDWLAIANIWSTMSTQPTIGKEESSKLHKLFDAKAYLNARYTFGDSPDVFRLLFPLQQFHEFYNSLPNGLKILEYGCGPVPAFLISAAPHASEIVMAEFAEVNRKAIWQWVEKDPRAFDWSPHFDHVVQKLEGKKEEEARKREEQLRKAIKAIVFCDLKEEWLIEKGYEGPYDIISTTGCLEAGCESLEHCVKVVRKLSSFLKAGGRMVISLVDYKPEILGKHFVYPVGLEQFPHIALTADFVMSALEDAGFNNVTMERSERASGNDFSKAEWKSTAEWVGAAFVTGIKPN